LEGFKTILTFMNWFFKNMVCFYPLEKCFFV
jgi:hypothetical protein